MNYRSKKPKEREKDKSKTISFRGSSPIVFHDLGRGRCETDGREKENRREEKNFLVSKRYLNAVYNTDKNKKEKIEIWIAIFPPSGRRVSNLLLRN